MGVQDPVSPDPGVGTELGRGSGPGGSTAGWLQATSLGVVGEDDLRTGHVDCIGPVGLG